MRFIVVDLEPGRIWNTKAIVDTVERQVVAKSESKEWVEAICALMNKHHIEPNPHMLTDGTSEFRPVEF